MSIKSTSSHPQKATQRTTDKHTFNQGRLLTPSIVFGTSPYVFNTKTLLIFERELQIMPNEQNCALHIAHARHSYQNNVESYPAICRLAQPFGLPITDITEPEYTTGINLEGKIFKVKDCLSPK